jgi:hypothetical protein
MKNAYGGAAEVADEALAVPPPRSSVTATVPESVETTPLLTFTLAPGSRFPHSARESTGSSEVGHEPAERPRPFYSQPDVYDMPNDAFDDVIAANEDWSSIAAGGDESDGDVDGESVFLDVNEGESPDLNDGSEAQEQRHEPEVRLELSLENAAEKSAAAGAR